MRLFGHCVYLKTFDAVYMLMTLKSILGEETWNSRAKVVTRCLCVILPCGDLLIVSSGLPRDPAYPAGAAACH